MTVDIDRLADAVVERMRADRDERPDDRPLLTIDDAASRLGISPRTLRDMVRRKRIATIRVEGARRVEQSAIDAYLAARREEGEDG